MRQRTVLVMVVGWLIVGTNDARAEKPAPQRVPPAAELVKMVSRRHPRLLLDEAGLETLRKQTEQNAGLRELARRCQRDADKLLSAPLPKHVLPDGKRLLATSRRVVDDTYALAMSYRLSGDRRYLDRLWSEFETVAKFPDFNPKHFLDTAEMTHALAVGYDWLYASWSNSQRSTIRQAMVRMGLEPGLAVYKRNSGWHKSLHNWNQVCNGGLTAGALALADEEAELAGQILEHAIRSVPLAMASYAPDGAWGEGPGYWGYATQYNVLMLACLQSAMGSDFGLSKLPGFAETGLFPVYITSPIGRSFNFEDSGDGAPRGECLFWLAKRFNLPVCAWFAVQGKNRAPAMVWYPDRMMDPEQASLPLDKYWRYVEAATFRGKWNDPKATFVGFLAGDNRVNHNHLDSGTFVLDALGQRWSVDLGGDNYNLPGYFGRQRYDYYRLRAEAHNTLVIDPGKSPDQDPSAAARMVRFESGSDRAFAIADLTPVYGKPVRRVERGVALLKRRDVLVQDEVDARLPVDVWWFMHTPAKVRLSEGGRRATLSQGGETLTAAILEPAAAKFELRAAQPLPSSPHPAEQKSNERTQTLAIAFPKASKISSAVLFVPSEQSSVAPPTEIRPLGKW